MDCLERDCHGYDHEDWHPVELIDIPGTIIIPRNRAGKPCSGRCISAVRPR